MLKSKVFTNSIFFKMYEGHGLKMKLNEFIIKHSININCVAKIDSEI